LIGSYSYLPVSKANLVYDFRSVKQEDGNYLMVHGPKHTAETHWEGRRAYAERVANGFRLFGKYYQSLWD
jgi:hypothetical protein